MHVQLKAVLLIALLAGYEAHRIKAQVDKAKLINGLTGFGQKAAAGMESGDWECNEADVIVQAKFKTDAGDQKLDVRVQKGALTTPVEVGRKTKKNGCDFVYSLLCENDLTTLRQQMAPCTQQSSDCESCASYFAGRSTGILSEGALDMLQSDLDGPKDGTFGFWKLWRTTEQHKGQSLFKFSDSFNSEYADGALEDSRKVHFTPTGETCAEARDHITEQKDTLKEVLTGLNDVHDKGDFKARTAMLKPFQKAKMGYDKMGCESTPIMDAGFLEEMVASLRETFVNARQPDVDEATSRQRFDDTLEYIKSRSSDVSLKDAIKASGIALGNEVSTNDDEERVDGSEEVTPEMEDMLEDKLGEQSTALVQLQEGQVALKGRAGPIVAVAAFFVTLAVLIAILILFWYVVLWLFIVAVIISAGILTWAAINTIINDR